MNKCLNCGQETNNNKFCSISCQHRFQKASQIDKRLGMFLDFTIKCNKCGKEFVVNERENLFPQKEKYYCSRSCANKRIHSEETKKKISKRIKELIKENPEKYSNGGYNSGSELQKKREKIVKIICKKCLKEFCVPYGRRNRQFCCKTCASNWMKGSSKSQLTGLLSVQAQKDMRRSKNEIYFSELCKNHFNKVLTNEPIFNGWDADVIIEDIKMAVLWNGKWHYEKITKKHSVKQVQNRDKIRIKEIKEYGYNYYIIKDMGRQNKKFVEDKFNTFIKMLGTKNS